MDDDPMAGEELLAIEELLPHIFPDLNVSFANVPPIDTTLPSWRE